MRMRSAVSPLPAMPIASKRPIRRAPIAVVRMLLRAPTTWVEGLVVKAVFGELRRFLIDANGGPVRAHFFGLGFGLELNLRGAFAAAHGALQSRLEVDFLALVAGRVGIGDVVRQGRLTLPGAAHSGLEQLLGRIDESHKPFP